MSIHGSVRDDKTREEILIDAIKFHLDNTITLLDDGKTIRAFNEVNGTHEHLHELRQLLAKKGLL